jgi:L-amino acid N-acyltransferase YncA
MIRICSGWKSSFEQLVFNTYTSRVEKIVVIRQMKRGEENEIRTLYAKLSFEDQTLWRKQTKPIREYLAEASEMPITEEIKGKNVILVAEEDGTIAGFCWCTIVDRGVDKQAEVAELYVETEYRGRGLGSELLAAARQLFVNEEVEVAFAWTHRGNKEAKELYKSAGFQKVDQLVMAFIPPRQEKDFRDT